MPRGLKKREHAFRLVKKIQPNFGWVDLRVDNIKSFNKGEIFLWIEF